MQAYPFIKKIIEEIESLQETQLKSCLKNHAYLFHRKEFAQRIFRYRFYYMCPEQTAKKMIEYHGMTQDERKKKLEAELKKYALLIRTDSQYCLNYIQGDIDVDIEEIGAIMFMTSIQFRRGGPAVYNHYSDNVEQAFVISLYNDRNTIPYSIKYALKEIPKRIPNHVFRMFRYRFYTDDDEDDEGAFYT
jgi:hypothetical protein